MTWSLRSFRFFTLSFFLEKGKNGHGALVGLTWVKGTSVDKFSYFFAKKEVGENGFWHL